MNTSHIKISSNLSTLEALGNQFYVCSTDLRNIFSVSREDSSVIYCRVQYQQHSEMSAVQNTFTGEYASEDPVEIEWTLFPQGYKFSTLSSTFSLNLDEFSSKYVRVVAKSSSGYTVFQPILLSPDYVPLFLPLNDDFGLERKTSEMK
jgi:hypothetical protein